MRSRAGDLHNKILLENVIIQRNYQKTLIPKDSGVNLKRLSPANDLKKAHSKDNDCISFKDITCLNPCFNNYTDYFIKNK